MNNLTKDQILAASSGWIATILNFLPGLGTGYLYQRRWVPYFITAGVATAWFVLGAILNGETEPTKSEQIIWIGGLFFISLITMIEAKNAHMKAKITTEEKLMAKTPKRKAGLFR